MCNRRGTAPVVKGDDMLTTGSKVWGKAIKIQDNGLSKTSVLHVERGGTCSWHYHKHRYNTFYVVSGEVIIRWSPSHIANDKKYEIYLKPGCDLTIAPGDAHEFMAVVDSVMVEIDCAGNRIGDIVRLRPGFKAKRVKNVRLGRKP